MPSKGNFILIQNNRLPRYIQKDLVGKTIKGDCNGRMKQSHGLAMTEWG